MQRTPIQLSSAIASQIEVRYNAPRDEANVHPKSDKDTAPLLTIPNVVASMDCPLVEALQHGRMKDWVMQNHYDEVAEAAKALA